DASDRARLTHRLRTRKQQAAARASDSSRPAVAKWTRQHQNPPVMISRSRRAGYLAARGIEPPPTTRPEMRREAPKRFRELEQAIDEAVNSYSGALAIDNLESAALPNKRAVIEAYQRLKPVLYMGFYSTRALT